MKSQIAFVLLSATIAFIVAFSLDLMLSSLFDMNRRKKKHVPLPSKISASISTKKLSSCQPPQKPVNLDAFKG
ncbi:8581_t:CDS:2 [Funneliformis mosseae]|uniref:8581_t:CDS:1 n=1 Tax=Funneliformis mosseae TaxID=27381 RepID=A0A9N9C1P3_FUNMO|nr:8581_t:CDS:2 [Funneliformis mosseae]